MARRLAQIGVLGWIIVMPMLIGIFAGRWLDAQVPFRTVLDRAAADAGRGARAAGPPGNGCRAHEHRLPFPLPWAMLLSLAVHLAAGVAVGALYFRTLWWTTRSCSPMAAATVRPSR